MARERARCDHLHAERRPARRQRIAQQIAQRQARRRHPIGRPARSRSSSGVSHCEAEGLIFLAPGLTNGERRDSSRSLATLRSDTSSSCAAAAKAAWVLRRESSSARGGNEVSYRCVPGGRLGCRQRKRPKARRRPRGEEHRRRSRRKRRDTEPLGAWRQRGSVERKRTSYEGYAVQTSAWL